MAPISAVLTACLAGAVAGQLVADWNGHGMESSHVDGNWPDGTPCLNEDQFNALAPALRDPEISKRCAECASPEAAPWHTEDGFDIISCGHQRSSDIVSWFEDGYECIRLSSGQTSVSEQAIDASDCAYCKAGQWSFWPDFRIRCGDFRKLWKCHWDSQSCVNDLAKAQKKRKRWCGHCCTDATCRYFGTGPYCGHGKDVCSWSRLG